MSKWILKALVQKSISFLPQKEKINYWFQKNITKGVRLNDQYFTYKIAHARDHISYYNKFSTTGLEKSKVLELGTGWYPIVPIALYLSGAKSICSIDLSDWLTKENLRETCQQFIHWRKRNMLVNYLPDMIEHRWEEVENIAKNSDLELKQQCEILLLEPWVGDARNTPFDNGQFDFICSNNTFEHIPKNVLANILLEFKRVIKPQGVMSHFIDMTDHFAHFDQAISIYNFLKFPEWAWKLIDNNIQAQNRMRFTDYKNLYRELHLPVTLQEIIAGKIEDLDGIKLAAQFHKYTREELAVSHGYIITKLD